MPFKMSEFISIKNYRPRIDDAIFPEPINWEIREGEVCVVLYGVGLLPDLLAL